MGDLKDPRLMYLKAALFLLAGSVSVVGILIEHYIDPRFKFAGLGSFVLYLTRARRAPHAPDPPAPED